MLLALLRSIPAGPDVRRPSRRLKPTANFRRGNSTDREVFAGRLAAASDDEAARPIGVIASGRSFYRRVATVAMTVPVTGCYRSKKVAPMKVISVAANDNTRHKYTEKNEPPSRIALAVL